MLMDVNNIKAKDLIGMLEQSNAHLSRQRLYDKIKQPNMTVKGAMQILEAMGYEIIVRERGKPYRDDEVRIDFEDDYVPNNAENMRRNLMIFDRDGATATEIYLAYHKLTFNKKEVGNIMGMSYPTLMKRYGKYFEGKNTVTLNELTEMLNGKETE